MNGKADLIVVYKTGEDMPVEIHYPSESPLEQTYVQPDYSNEEYDPGTYEKLLEKIHTDLLDSLFTRGFKDLKGDVRYAMDEVLEWQKDHVKYGLFMLSKTKKKVKKPVKKSVKKVVKKTVQKKKKSK